MASWRSPLDIVGKAYQKANQSWQAIEQDIDSAVQSSQDNEQETDTVDSPSLEVMTDIGAAQTESETATTSEETGTDHSNSIAKELGDELEDARIRKEEADVVTSDQGKGAAAHQDVAGGSSVVGMISQETSPVNSLATSPQQNHPYSNKQDCTGGTTGSPGSRCSAEVDSHVFQSPQRHDCGQETISIEKYNQLKQKFMQARELISKLRDARQKLNKENERLVAKLKERNAKSECENCQQLKANRDKLTTSMRQYQDQISFKEKEIQRMGEELKERDEKIQSFQEEGDILSRKQVRVFWFFGFQLNNLC